MRIIIQIDGVELTSETAKPQISTEVLPLVSAKPGAPGALTPPPEILEVAAALGADNAGPAPTLAEELGVPIASAPPSFGDIADEGFDRMDAGMAPNVSLDVEPEAD
jgi:hypothetical protein